MNRLDWGVLAVAVCWACDSIAGAAVISQIPLSQFDDPKVLDFESASNGTVSGTASLFTDFGIASVSATATGDQIDAYNVVPSGRALFFQSGTGLVLQTPTDVTGPPLFNLSSEFMLTFAEPRLRFGVAFPDAAAEFRLEFFSSGDSLGFILVDTGPVINTDPPVLFTFETSEPFDSVVISKPDTDMFGLDNLVLETASIPEPGTMALVVAGVLTLVRGRPGPRQPE